MQERRQRDTRHSPHTWFGLAVLCLAAALTLLHSAVLSPLLRPIGQDFGTSDAATGQLATLGSLAGFAFALAATPWMDRWSRRTWLRLEGALLLGAVLLSALAPSIAWLVMGRVVGSCGMALIMANCMSGARELFPDPVWRNRAIGFIISATTVASIVGLPAIIQLDARFGWRVAMGSIAMPVALMLIGTFWLPPALAAAAAPAPRGRPLSAFRAVLGHGRTRALLVVLGLNLALYSGWFVYFGAYATDVFAVSAGVLSAIFLISGVSQLATNNLAPPLLRRFDAVRVLNATGVAIAAALLLTGIAITTVPAALLAAVVVLNGTVVAYIAANVLLLDSESAHPGAVMALAAATSSLGAALGPLLTGLALAGTGSFEAAYRTLGLLAPLSILTLWLGTRRATPPALVERALTD